MTTSTPIVQVHNLTKVHGLKPNYWALTSSQFQGSPTRSNPGFEAVKSISFHVQQGEVYGLLGTNGAGKSSTLEVLEGLASPTSGTVQLFGKDPVKDRNKVRPLMGIMLQDGGLPQELTVRETLQMWAGISSRPHTVAEALDAVRLTHRAENKVGGLSGGEQRRLDLACALLNNPQLLFLDEPTTGLDPESRLNTWELLAELKQRGVTMILTTHYLEEAERLCDRIAIMNQGRIELEGTREELVATQPSQIAFQHPLDAQGRRCAEIPDLPPGLTGTVLRDSSAQQTQFTLSSHALQHDAFRLLNWADQHQLQLPQFSATPANLESVFMSIAGRKV